MEIEKLENNLLSVAEYAFEHGEILKALQLIKAAPIPLQDSSLLKRIKKRIDHISNFQANGRNDAGFVDPPDVTKKMAYMKLKEVLPETNCRYLIDVGCFSGWVGRNLSLWGYKVHGVDLDPFTIEMATRMATGTGATYEVLEGVAVGQKYNKHFDGAILFDVVEHVFDDTLLLASVEKAVRECVFINLPQYDVADQLSRTETDDHVKEHLRSYSDEDLDRVFGNKKDVKIEKLNDPEDPSYFIWYKV